MALHSFDPDIAEKVGVNAAVIYQNLVFWIEKNQANDKHFHEGKYWTYNSISAFEQMFSYLTTSQIRTAIKHLLESGLIVEGNFNKKGYDRTKWYSVISQVHLSNLANGFDKNPNPIPDIKPDIKPYNTITSPDGDLNLFGGEPLTEDEADWSLPSEQELFEMDLDELWDMYPRKVGKGGARKALKAALKKVDFGTIYDGVNAFTKKVAGKDKQFIPHFATWLNQERWGDE
jgi:hypothetical protein